MIHGLVAIGILMGLAIVLPVLFGRAMNWWIDRRLNVAYPVRVVRVEDYLEELERKSG